MNWACLVWTLPLQKLFLVAGLVFAHHYRLGFRDLFFVVPETVFALWVTSLYCRHQRFRWVTLPVGVITPFLAFASWFVIAPWVVSGTLLPYEQLKQFVSGTATLETVIYSSSLLTQVLVWIGIFLLLCAFTFFLRAWAGRKRSFPGWLKRTKVMTLLGIVFIGSTVASGELRPTNRFAMVAPFFGHSAASFSSLHPVDPHAMAVLGPPNRHRAFIRSFPIKNVLLIILESVRYQPGSLLDEGFPKAAHLLRTYGHHPRSVKTIEGLLFGIYPSVPLLTAAWSIDGYDVSRMDPLPRVLRRNGYRTTYFAGTNLGFDNYRQVLEVSGFERVETVSSDKRSLAWGSDADTLLSTAEATLEKGREKGQRQFVMVWTTECHMPYDFLGQKDKGVDPRSQYLACQDALAHSLDRMLKRMEHSGMLGETLIIVMGDHGQIFSNEKKGEWGHGQHVYEQSLRIPLLLFIPGYEGGRDRERLFQPVDVPATILSLLNLSVPKSWVGRNMLDPSEPGRDFIVFLSTLSDGIMGVLEKSGSKYIRNNPRGPFLCYTLKSDPHEEMPQHVTPEMELALKKKIDTYLHVAEYEWESKRKGEDSGRQSFQGKEIADQWANGPCITTRADEVEGVTLVNPVLTKDCQELKDPFMTRAISRTFPARQFKEALRLEFQVRITEKVEAQGMQPRALVKLWEMEKPVFFDLRPVAGEWQTVSVVLPKSNLRIDPSTGQEGRDLWIEIVPVDPNIPFAMRRITVQPVETHTIQWLTQWFMKLKP